MWFKYGLKAQKLQKQHALKGRVGQNLQKFSYLFLSLRLNMLITSQHFAPAAPHCLEDA